MKTDEKLKPEKAVRPASRWRNRYLALQSFSERDPGPLIFRLGGKEFTGYLEWPTRDTAETYGLRYEMNYDQFVKYLGAFPVEGE